MIKHLSHTSSVNNQEDSPPPYIETPRLTASEAGFRVYYQGKELYPSEPEKVVAAKAQALILEENTAYILCSPVLWYGVDQLIARLPATSSLLVCEVDEQLFSLVDWKEKYDAYGNTLSIHIVQSYNPVTIVSELPKLFNRKTKRVRSLSLNAGRILHAAVYQELQRRAEEELRRFWRNMTTTLFMGPLWIRNILRNCARPQPYQDISALPSCDHIVVCGAGPSLEDAISLIQRYRARLYVVAVDTALPILHGFDIEPDLVVALEAQVANLKDFVPCGKHHPAIAYDLSSTPALLHSINFSDHYLFSSEFADGSHWNRLKSNDLLPTVIPPLGSVGVCALYLSHFSARVSVSMVGLDFAWSAGLSHARGSPVHLHHLTSHNRLSHGEPEVSSLGTSAEKVTGVRGKKVFTDKVLSSYAQSTNEVIQYLRSKNLSVFDLRFQGLPLDTTEGIPEFEALLSSSSTTTDPKSIQPVQPHRTPTKFLEDLRTDIEKSIQLVRARISVPTTDPRALLESLSALDFLFYDIPDQEWPSAEPHAIVRALARLQLFCDRISRLLE